MPESDTQADLQAFVAGAVSDSIAVKQRLEPIYPDIERAAEILLHSIREGGKALFFGNGGSAADAQHFACELVGQFTASRPPLPAMALTVDTSVVTAISNDFGYEMVFSRQLRAHARPGDVAIAISTSGVSRNVIAAAKLKHVLGIKLIALTGDTSDSLAPFADAVIAIPSGVTARIQEAHVLVGHIICEWVERQMFPETLKS